MRGRKTSLRVVLTAEERDTFIREWNEVAHPFNWTSKSVAKVMAKCRIEDATPLAGAA